MRKLTQLALVAAASALTAAAQFAITTPSPLPTAVVGQSYSPVTLQTAGDPGPVVWSLAPGSVAPPGFAVSNAPSPDTTGIFCYGTPCTGVGVQTGATLYTFTIVATSIATNQSTSKQFDLLVVKQPVQITTTSLPPAASGQPYSSTIVAVGGVGPPYTWSIVSGLLPPGFGIDPATGTLGGTTPAGTIGSYTFTVKALDPGSGLSAVQAFNLNVGAVISITTTALPNGTLNEPYSFQLQQTGAANPVWTLQQTAQTPGLFSITTGGLLSGFGLATGKYSITVQLTDESQAGAVTKTFPFFITLGPLSIQETTIPGGTQNVAYSAPLTAVGGLPPYTWALGTVKPGGLSIDANTGVLSGTPPNSGTFDIPVTLTDSTGTVYSWTFSLSVARAVSISTTSLPDGSPGVGYNATLAAVGGSIPFTWSVSAGALPPGLKLDASSGVISGIPNTQGAYSFTIQVSDFFKGTATKAFTIVVGQVQPLVITTTSLPDSALTQTYSQNLAATGGVLPYTWSVASGSLPQGLQLSANNGVIGGIPTKVGSYPFVILVTDARQNVARQNLSINVADPSNPVVVSGGDFTGFVLTPFSQTMSATGGTPPYTWSVTTGTLPAGLQLDAATGKVTGSPGAPGVSAVTFTATDANGQRGSKPVAFSITLPTTPSTSINLGSTTQQAVSLTTDAPFPLEITGFLTLTFASSVGGTDDMVRFSNGSRSLEYIVRANQTTAIFPTATNPAILPGTVAGTITVTASLAAGGQDITPSTPPTKTITIAAAVPVITAVTLQQTSGGVTVVVTGYSNTREVSSGGFTFTASGGNTLSQPALTVALTSAYATWFNNTASNATGGLFKLTVPFTVNGNAAAITKVSVTLTNSKGSSAAVSSP